MDLQKGRAGRVKKEIMEKGRRKRYEFEVGQKWRLEVDEDNPFDAPRTIIREIIVISGDYVQYKSIAEGREWISSGRWDDYEWAIFKLIEPGEKEYSNPFHQTPEDRSKIMNATGTMAYLPEDFVRIIGVCRCNEKRDKVLPCLSIQEMTSYYNFDKRFSKDAYSISDSGNRIYFSRSFSRLWVIRIWQKYQERINPVKYKIEYLPVKLPTS